MLGIHREQVTLFLRRPVLRNLLQLFPYVVPIHRCRKELAFECDSHLLIAQRIVEKVPFATFALATNSTDSEHSETCPIW